jgi:Ser/Thr protein kinase RdoA (MazF antagonist)
VSVRYSPEEMQRRREAVRERFADYARSRILPALGGREPLSLTAPADGLGSLVFFLEAEGMPSAVLRGAQRRKSMAMRVGGHRLLQAHGLPVPEVPWVDLSPWTRLRWGYHFALEERRTGVAFDLAPAPELVGALFARMHGVQGRVRGRVGAKVAWLWAPPPRSWLRRKARRWLGAYKASCGEHSGPSAAEAEAWVAAWPEEAWVHPPRLTMGDVTQGNILVDGNEVSLIDLSGVGYLSAPFEVLKLRHRLLHSDEALWERLWAAYFEAAAPDLRAELELGLPLLEGLRFMRLVGLRAARGGDVETHLEGLRRQMASRPPAPSSRA